MVIVFDVMGTLLDPAPLEPVVKRVTRGRMSARQFFGDVATYAMANTLSGAHPAFETVAGAVLEMSAAAHGGKLAKNDIARLRQLLGSMPAFPDVKPALKRLHERGLRLAVLSNANEELLQEQLKRAKLANYFEQAVSVDSAARRFKPSLAVYESALERLGGHPHEVLMVAAHAWDLMGAARAGFRTALIERHGEASYPGAAEPNYVAEDLENFADQLLGQSTAKPRPGNEWLLTLSGLAIGIALAGSGICDTVSQHAEETERERQFV